MSRRRYLADLEAQVSDANAAERAEHRAAARRDRDDYVWINGHAYDIVTGPDAADRWEDR